MKTVTGIISTVTNRKETQKKIKVNLWNTKKLREIRTYGLRRPRILAETLTEVIKIFTDL